MLSEAWKEKPMCRVYREKGLRRCVRKGPQLGSHLEDSGEPLAVSELDTEAGSHTCYVMLPHPSPQ